MFGFDSGATAVGESLGAQFLLPGQIFVSAFGIVGFWTLEDDMNPGMFDKPGGQGVEHLLVAEVHEGDTIADRHHMMVELACLAAADGGQAASGIEGDDVGVLFGEYQQGVALLRGCLHLDVAQAHGLGTSGRVEVEVKDVFAARRGDASREVGVEAIGGDAKGGVVFLGVDGETKIGGVGVAIKVDEIDVVAAKALPAVGGEVEGVPVGMQKGEFLVACGVDASAEVLGAAPVAVGQTVATPEVGSSLASLPVRGKEQPSAVGRYRRLRPRRRDNSRL